MIKHLRHVVYFAGFLASLHLALPAYINSTFLASLVGGDQFVGLVFVVASILSLVSVAYAAAPIKRLGLRRTTIGLTIFTALIGGLLFYNPHPLIGLAAFVVFYAGGITIKFLLDIYLEDLSDDTATGRIRGLFLTLGNLAWLMSAFFASGLINEIYFERIYLAATIVLLPFFILILWPLKNIVEPKYEHASFFAGLKILWCRDGVCDKNIRSAVILNFILNLFFAFMVIYLPLYLGKNGLGWSEIGIIFTWMLLPFTLFQYPLGRLADKYFGEKEIMSIGLVIMSLTTAVMAFMYTPSVLAWSVILFINRTGASAVEGMIESYFFKHTHARNVNTISFFRNVGPLALITAPILATIIFAVAPLVAGQDSYGPLFLVLAAIVLYGLRYSLTLVDTK